MDYGHPERNYLSLHSRKFTPTPKFLGMTEPYFVSHIDPTFQISLTYVCRHWVSVVREHCKDLYSQSKLVKVKVQMSAMFGPHI